MSKNFYTSMYNFASRIYHNHIDPELILSRYKTGNSDLKKGIRCSTKISQEQYEEITAFWKPLIKGFLGKITFNMKWYDIYNCTNVFGFDLKQYIPDSYYYCIVDRYFNKLTSCKELDDKNLYDLYFRDVNQPKTIFRKEGLMYLDSNYRIISETQALHKCLDKENGVILKSSVNASAGAGIHKWSPKKQTIDDLRRYMQTHSHLICQELIMQHECLRQFNETCVNTIRMVTLLLNGEVSVVTSAVIMGGENATTNHLHSGGIVCGIHSNGNFYHTAFDSKLNEYKKHPNGILFESCKIHNYEKCIDLVKFLAPRFSRVSKLISWDVTINEKGEPLLIEPNLFKGGVIQIASGPVFGNRTEEILSHINENGGWRI